MQMLATNTHAQSLSESITELTQSHKRVIAAEVDLQAAKERAAAANGDWYPTFDATTSYGYEDQNKGQGTQDTAMVPRVLDMSITQRVWDFGSANAGIDRAEIEINQSEEALRATRQNVALEGINAYLNVVRQRKLLEFTLGSIANIKKQAQLEDSKVQRGSGLATDVLQAKTQLAGSEASRIGIEGALRNATNRYRAVFGALPPNTKEMSHAGNYLLIFISAQAWTKPLKLPAAKIPVYGRRIWAR